MGVGQESLAIKRDFERPPSALWHGLRGVPSSLVADADSRVRAIGYPLHSYGGRADFIGPVFTVGSGSLAHWAALELVQPGDVLAIACGNRRDCSEFGSIFVAIAHAKGVAAILTDGLLRDADDIAGLDIPVFACGTHPSSPFDPSPGTVGHRITFTDAVLDAGDILIGDRDGIAIAPAAQLESIAAAIPQQRLHEGALKDAIASGGALPPKLRERLARMSVTRGDQA